MNESREGADAMTEAEYREFLSFLFERYVRPRITRVRHRYRHHFEDEFAYHLDHAVRSAQMFRFIENYCHEPGVRHTIGYVDLQRKPPGELAKMILRKLGHGV
jgi:hypothetical protein